MARQGAIVEPVIVTRAGTSDEIATVALNNPDRLNALNKPTWERLGVVMRELSADDTLRCVVLRGAGDKAFAAGADIAEFASERADARQAKIYGDLIHDTMQSVASCKHPTVAMIQGACVGGGLWLSVHDPLLIYEQSKPCPDLTIHRSAPDLELALPSRANTLLVMEVADLSLDYDRDKKLPLYGKWQIPEAWLFDVARRRIERHTEPNLAGYTRVEIAQGHGSLTSMVLPGLAISVEAAMG